MKEKSQWVVRKVVCPECACGDADLLIEWKVEKGKKVLHSIHCDNPEMSAYSGKECQWVCMEKLSPQKTKKGPGD
jgi:hypothetical protein